MHRLLLCTTIFLFGIFSEAHAFSHDIWNSLLQTHVHDIDGGKSTQVDYRGMSAERKQLNQYLSQLATVNQKEFDSWSRDGQLAFLINSYNAWTVELVLTRYPDLDSIKDLGSLFKSPWKKVFIPLLGKDRSLDDIEHGLIRGSGRYNEPRIHFAVNCASIGCPPLRNEAYTGERLDEQLEDATRRFLSDSSRNRFEENSFKVSSIFKWYRKDFTQGWRGAESLTAFFALYPESLGISQKQQEMLPKKSFPVHFLDYNWSLNSL